MSRRLIVQPQSELDVTAAAVWYDDRQRGLGARFLDELSEIFQRIQNNPLEFPRIDNDVRRALLRHYPFGVYFLEDASDVKVIAVLHLHRHPDMWKSRS